MCLATCPIHRPSSRRRTRADLAPHLLSRRALTRATVDHATQVIQLTENPRVDGSIPSLAAILSRSIPATFTGYTGHMVNTFEANGLVPGSTRAATSSKNRSVLSIFVSGRPKGTRCRPVKE